MMSIKSVAAAFALAACIGLAGCASQKEPAEQAMAAIAFDAAPSPTSQITHSTPA